MGIRNLGSRTGEGSALRTLSMLVVAGLLVAVVGCTGGYDEGAVEVTGKLLKGGQPLGASGEGKDRITYRVTFTKEGATGAEAYNAMIDVNESGEFALAIPPGKYKVAIMKIKINPLAFGGFEKVEDKDLEKFTPAKSPIVVTVPDDVPLEIDISKY